MFKLIHCKHHVDYKDKNEKFTVSQLIGKLLFHSVTQTAVLQRNMSCIVQLTVFC
jgi:hypothetical protein